MANEKKGSGYTSPAARPGKRVKHHGIESRKSWYGFFFVLPWIIGTLFFFLIPIIQSVMYSFSSVTVEATGLVKTFTGLENYRYVLMEDPNFTTNLSESFGTFLFSMPIIVILSMIISMVLNQKFHGRIFFRSLFFIPVIVATGVVMTYMTNKYGGMPPIIQLSTDTTNEYVGGGINFEEVLAGLNLPDRVSNAMATYIGMIFNLIWSCGIPIILFIAGLQTIPAQLYEASKVEGASAWEEFWYVTLPMLGHTLLLVIIFVTIDLLTQSSNAVMAQAYSLMTKTQVYDTSSAMLWAFYLVIGVVMAVIVGLYSKICLKRWS